MKPSSSIPRRECCCLLACLRLEVEQKVTKFNCKAVTSSLVCICCVQQTILASRSLDSFAHQIVHQMLLSLQAQYQATTQLSLWILSMRNKTYSITVTHTKKRVSSKVCNLWKHICMCILHTSDQTLKIFSI